MRIGKIFARLLLVFVVLVATAGAIKWWQDGQRIAHAQAAGWYQLSRAATDLLPDPATHPGALVAVLAAPAYGWRGYFAVHPWIVYKRAGDASYTRYEVIGWHRHNPLRRNHMQADSLWYGATPDLLVLHQGQAAQDLIEPIESAIQDYTYSHTYRTFPGPNSNTFVAHIGRHVPALGLDLPPTAIGKDYRPLSAPVGLPPSGRGLQFSLEGLLGFIVSPQEGLEINVLGLGVGIDLDCPSLRLPFIGRLGPNIKGSAQSCAPERIELNRETS